MKSVLFGSSAFLLIASTLLFSTTAFANTSGFSCNISAKPIINVVEKVKNDADSGIAGDTWALDSVTRTIKVWNVSGNTYCATAIYNSGAFQAVTGHASPGNNGTLTGDEVGTFTGGYVTTVFSGELNVSDPTHWPLKGKVTNSSGGSVVDYMCTTDPNPSCPGYIDWTTKYFTTTTGYSLADWGWLYRTPHKNHDGTWTNALSGNSGDILDVDP